MSERHTEGSGALKRPHRYTYRDYREWPAAERWELIDGHAWSMSPAPRRRHQGVVVKVSAQLDAYFTTRQCKSYVAPCDLFLPDGDEPIDEVRNVVQPDAFVICDPSALIDEGVRGAPALVIEVLSPSTALKDQTEKRQLYEAYGVHEYWIINPETLELFRYHLVDGRYPLPDVVDLRVGVTSTRFPDLTVRVRREDL